MPSGSHDINVKLLVLMGILSTILVIALVVSTQAWFRYEFQQEINRKYVEVPYTELVDQQAAQQAGLDRPVKTTTVNGESVVEVTAIQWAMDQTISQQAPSPSAPGE